MKVIVLISGRGSNCRSLIEFAANHQNRVNYQVSAVLSDKSDAAGLLFAQQAGIDIYAFSRRDAASRLDHKQRIYDKIETLEPELIVLAGFMQILEAPFVERYSGKIVNIHPSLLPAFRGLDTHQRAMSAYKKSGGLLSDHGCTVHFVDAGVDTGAIIAQARLSIEPDDDPCSLARRVLKQEHRLFPWVVDQIARGMILFSEDKVTINELVRREGAQAGFELF